MRDLRAELRNNTLSNPLARAYAGLFPPIGLDLGGDTRSDGGSALGFHELTPQVPREIHLAIARTSRPPRLEFPPLHVYRFSAEAFKAGIEVHAIDGIGICIYSAEKTLADCFKYRNKIGMDVVLEALRAYRSRRKPHFQKVLAYAKVSRVKRLMRPYLETLA